VDVQDQLDILRAEVDELQATVADLIQFITKEATPPRPVPQDMGPFVTWHGAPQRRTKADKFGHPEFGNPRIAEWIEWGKQGWTRRASDDESRTDR
jgi:hypothetical protein